MTRDYAAVAAEVSREAAERVAAFIPRRERGERCTSGRIPYGLPELRPRKSAERQIRYRQLTGLELGAGERVRRTVPRPRYACPNIRYRA